MLRAVALAAVVMAVPAIIVVQAVLGPARRAARWARHIIFDTVPEPTPAKRSPRLWQKEVDDEDWI